MMRQGKRMLSVLFVVTLLFNLLAASGGAVSAAEAGPLYDGSIAHISWPASESEMYMSLRVSESGFYSLTFRDFMQTGYLWTNVDDITTDSYVDGFYEVIGNEVYESDMMYLVSGHDYLLTVGYVDEQSESLNADVEIVFNKLDFTLPTVPEGDIGASTLLLSLDTTTSEYVQFTSATAGDYTICFSRAIGAYVEVYDKNSGEHVMIVDTQYRKENGDWQNNNKAMLTLEANTPYLLKIENYDFDAETYISIKKNTVEVTNFEALTDDTVFYAWESIDSSDLTYRVRFSDGTSRVMTGEEIGAAGLSLPEVYCLGQMYYANEWLYSAGKQPVRVYYNGTSQTAYVNVKAMNDWLISLNAEAVTENSECVLYNEYSEDYEICYWLMNVQNTGVYEFYSSEWDNLGYMSIEIIDDENAPVVYNEKLGGYPLVGGQNYTVSMEVLFETGDSVTFYPQMETSRFFPDVGKGWYTDAVAYAVGRGILSGYKNGNFGTTNGIQRQDFLVMLARLDGVDLEMYEDTYGMFPDVAAGSYYEAAVNWGYENGIVTGYNSGNFGVGDLVTREQLVTFLYRYAQYRSCDIGFDPSVKAVIANTYADAGRISPYASDPIAWGVDNGVIKGKSATKIAPQGTAQRCEVAQMMYNIFVSDVF